MRALTSALGMGVLAISMVALPVGDAWAARKKAQPGANQPAKTAQHKAKRAKSQSGESTADRDRRLSRECKGLPNAGACLGYAN